MVKNTPTAVMGVFSERARADQAAAELAQAGFSPDQVDIHFREAPGTEPLTNMGPPNLRAEGGSAVGGIIGAVIGCLVGTILATGWISGIGPLFAGGALAGLIGAAIGAGIGGLLGALIGWAYVASAVGFYAREFHGGRTVMAVHANGRSAEAADILRKHGAYRVKTVTLNSLERTA